MESARLWKQRHSAGSRRCSVELAAARVNGAWRWKADYVEASAAICPVPDISTNMLSIRTRGQYGGQSVRRALRKHQSGRAKYWLTGDLDDEWGRKEKWGSGLV